MKRRLRPGWSVTLGAMLMTGLGCHSGPGGLPSIASLAEDLEPAPAAARISRLQRGEGVAPPPPLTPASLPTSREQGATVRAYVNGKAIFDYEILQFIAPEMRRMGSVAPAQVIEVQAKIYAQGLEALIDREVVYQEATRKLEKINPKALAKLKELAEQETDKVIQDVLKKGEKISPELLREQLPSMQRHIERTLVYGEYMRGRILPFVKSRVGLMEVRDYYEAHKNEFQRVDTVDWQDVFLAIGPKYPTPADARKAAEEMVSGLRVSADFVKLLPFDDGDSRLRGGKGLGSRRGEIRPAELEEYLFKMRDGEIGPIVEFSTGVHIFRLVKREVGGQIPLNEEIQKQIRDKLQNQLFDREAKRILRELRGKATIEYEGS